MRLGIFGGTFDPIHNGHLVLAEQCREQCQLDAVWFVPSACPPHKLGSAISSPKARCEMIEFAIAGNAYFQLNRMELDRSGISYTVTTLEQIHAEHPAYELFLLMGADSLRHLSMWSQPQRILELATVVTVNRGGEQSPDKSLLQTQLGPSIQSRLKSVQMPHLELSAGSIRQRVEQERSIRYLLPRAVEVYITQNGLYSKGPEPS
jgi:nicotinate-nucleotide adenylyltransferase